MKKAVIKKETKTKVRRTTKKKDPIMMDCCDNELNLHKLCVDHSKMKKVVADDICSQKGEFKDLHVENEIVNNICVPEKLQAREAWVDKSYSNTLCVSDSASIDKLCVRELRVSEQFEKCNVYRAAATSSAPFLYTLGAPINWNQVIDDPNGNVLLAPFSYTIDADQAGYYLFNFHLNISNLQGANVISGSPVGVQRILVNGVKLIDNADPFLTFANNQVSQFSGLVLLNGGDVITMDYNILVLDPVLGLQQYAGTVDVGANGTMVGNSFFDIIKLSGFCNGGSQMPCEPCPLVEIPCQSQTTPCQPIDRHCSPCDSPMPAPTGRR